MRSEHVEAALPWVKYNKQVWDPGFPWHPEPRTRVQVLER